MPNCHRNTGKDQLLEVAEQYNVSLLFSKNLVSFISQHQHSSLSTDSLLVLLKSIYQSQMHTQWYIEQVELSISELAFSQRLVVLILWIKD